MSTGQKHKSFHAPTDAFEVRCVFWKRKKQKKSLDVYKELFLSAFKHRARQIDWLAFLSISQRLNGVSQELWPFLLNKIVSSAFGPKQQRLELLDLRWGQGTKKESHMSVSSVSLMISITKALIKIRPVLKGLVPFLMTCLSEWQPRMINFNELQHNLKSRHFSG